MTIPEVRQRLYELSEAHQGTALGHELWTLASNLHRRQSKRSRTSGERVECRKVTPELAAAVRDYERDHPDETMLAIGRRFDINQGRVSEILYGKRT